MVKQRKKKIGTKNKEFLCIWVLLAIFCLACGVVLTLWSVSDSSLPDGVGRSLTQAEMQEVIGRNSPLTEYVYLSPNASFPRENKIQKITVHHMAGSLTLEAVGALFSDDDRDASANYAVDSQGRVGLYVEEENRAWTSSSPENDYQAVTIEVANDEIGGDWHVSDAAFEQLVELCADICRRNDIEKLVYTGDESGNLTIHKMFNSETECPGPYLESRMEDIAAAVNERLQ